MPQIKFLQGQAWEDTGPVLMSRVVGNDGSYIAQADVTSAHISVYDLSDTSVAIDAADLNVNDVVFDTLQTDAIWTVDTTGYNFKYEMAAAQIPEPGMYRVEIKIVPAYGEQFFLVYVLEVLEILSA